MKGILIVFLLLIGGVVWSGKIPDPQNAEPQWRKQLEELGYVETAAVSDPDDALFEGLVVYDKERSFPGYNLATPRRQNKAVLFDMEGHIIKIWHDDSETGAWQHVELCRNGDLLAFVKDHELLRISRNGRVKWRRKGRFHHDVTETPSGRILSAIRVQSERVVGNIQVPILEDRILVLRHDGKALRQIRFTDQLFGSVSPASLKRLRKWTTKHPEVFQKIRHWQEGNPPILKPDTPPDLFHLNSIQYLDHNLPGFCATGDLLISIRNLNLIAVFHTSTGKIGWTWGPGELEGQHHPTLLENGNILIFDNGSRRGFSRVIELDPKTSKIVWQYRGNKDTPFFSISRGSCQRLPNGNTLISETDRGRSFEVTRDGTIVWEYLNPIVERNTKNPRRMLFYRLQRLTEDACAKAHLLPPEDRPHPLLRSLGLTRMIHQPSTADGEALPSAPVRPQKNHPTKGGLFH